MHTQSLVEKKQPYDVASDAWRIYTLGKRGHKLVSAIVRDHWSRITLPLPCHPCSCGSGNHQMRGSVNSLAFLRACKQARAIMLEFMKTAYWLDLRIAHDTSILANNVAASCWLSETITNLKRLTCTIKWGMRCLAQLDIKKLWDKKFSVSQFVISR